MSRRKTWFGVFSTLGFVLLVGVLARTGWTQDEKKAAEPAAAAPAAEKAAASPPRTRSPAGRCRFGTDRARLDGRGLLSRGQHDGRLDAGITARSRKTR